MYFLRFVLLSILTVICEPHIVQGSTDEKQVLLSKAQYLCPHASICEKPPLVRAPLGNYSCCRSKYCQKKYFIYKWIVCKIVGYLVGICSKIKIFCNTALHIINYHSDTEIFMPPFEEEGYIVLLMSVGLLVCRSVGRPDCFRWLS